MIAARSRDVHREAAIIRAGSEDDARTLALKAFRTPLLPSAPGRAVDVAPWREAEAVRVEMIQDQRYSAKGAAGILEPWGSAEAPLRHAANSRGRTRPGGAAVSLLIQLATEPQPCPT